MLNVLTISESKNKQQHNTIYINVFFVYGINIMLTSLHYDSILSFIEYT